MNNREKQAAFRQRQRAKGLIQITEWIPLADVSHFRLTAKLYRERAEPREVKQDASVVTEEPQRPPGASPHSRPDYPDYVKRLALALTNRGTAPAKIRDEIKARCGRSPDSKNWGKIIRSWRVWAAREDAARGE